MQKKTEPQETKLTEDMLDLLAVVHELDTIGRHIERQSELMTTNLRCMETIRDDIRTNLQAQRESAPAAGLIGLVALLCAMVAITMVLQVALYVR